MAGEMRAAGGARPAMRKVRRHEWTAAKRKRFLEELAATCNVAASLRAVRMGVACLYKLRRRDAAFRAGWAEALREGYAKLEMMLLDRAMNGTVKTVTRANGAVDKTHEYPNNLALQLLKLHKAGASEADAEHHPDEIEEVRARLLRKLKAIKKRLDKEREAQSEAEGAIPASGAA